MKSGRAHDLFQNGKACVQVVFSISDDRICEQMEAEIGIKPDGADGSRLGVQVEGKIRAPQKLRKESAPEASALFLRKNPDPSQCVDGKAGTGVGKPGQAGGNGLSRRSAQEEAALEKRRILFFPVSGINPFIIIREGIRTGILRGEMFPDTQLIRTAGPDGTALRKRAQGGWLRPFADQEQIEIPDRFIQAVKACLMIKFPVLTRIFHSRSFLCPQFSAGRGDRQAKSA